MLPWWLVKQVQTYGGEIGFAEFIRLTVLDKQLARMMELVDVLDSKSSGCEAVRVRVPLWAPSLIKFNNIRV